MRSVGQTLDMVDPMVRVEAIPRQLRILALVWLLIGIISALGHLRLNLELGFGPVDIGVMGLVFAPGLILAWNWVVVVIRWVSWFTIVVCFFAVVSCVVRGGISGWVGAAGGTGLICVLLEQLMILKEPEVRRYYESLKQAESESDATRV
jgi:hypothetical protein